MVRSILRGRLVLTSIDLLTIFMWLEWEAKPSSPESIRLISMGKMLNDKARLTGEKHLVLITRLLENTNTD